MTLCVLYASVVLAWSFKDEVSPYATFVVRSVKSARAVAPMIWPLEVNNALTSAVRRERIDELVADRIRNTLERLPLDIGSEVAVASLGQRILRLGIEHGLSAYDASYLEPARRRGLPIATQDQKLVKAAAETGVRVLQPRQLFKRLRLSQPGILELGLRVRLGAGRIAVAVPRHLSKEGQFDTVSAAGTQSPTECHDNIQM